MHYFDKLGGGYSNYSGSVLQTTRAPLKEEEALLSASLPCLSASASGTKTWNAFEACQALAGKGP